MSTSTSKVSISKEELEKYKRAYEASQHKYRNTKFLKKRIFFLIGSVLLLILVYPFITPSETELNVFSTIMGIAFLAIIVLIDEILLGLYLYDRKIQ